MKLKLLPILLFVIPAILSGCSPAPEPEPERETLPSVYVVTETGLPIRQREYERVTVTLVGSENGEFDFTDLGADMKCRGNSTFHLAKKPYRIKFDDKINVLGQGGGPSKSWVLLANFNDVSGLRNHVSFAMGKRLENIGFTSSSSFVHLYMNNVYKGVYELAEHHGEGKYRIVMNEDPDETDTDYLIEMDDYQKLRGIDVPNSFETGDRAYVVKSDGMTIAKWKFLYHYFKDVDEATSEGDRDRVCSLIDVPSFIDAYLLEEISKDPDAGISSFFYLKRGGGLLYCTCPWDFDIAYGNDPTVDDGSPEGLFVGNPDHEPCADYLPHPWFSALMRQKWFCDLVRERWDEKKDELKEAALSAIDETETRFCDEMNRNFDAWSLNGSAENRKNAVGDLREWIEARFDFLDGWFSDPSTLYSFVNTE